MPHASRNAFVAPGVGRFSRSAVYAKKALYKRKKTAVKPAVAKVATTKTVTVGGAKNGKTRVVPIAKTAALRSTITPGTVLILVAGRFRGKKVVFLKQLASGLLLVTGPYKVNGVPLRRVNQAYVIATSTKIDISKVKVDEKFNDAYFKREAKKTEAKFFDENTPKSELPASRVADQKAVDKAILPVIAKVPHLKAYLNASFSLKKGQAPHLMKF
ncbi:ribosomal protein L6e-domain-containing protein [Paraphysoderma sedebokerense]|nr:ribosomal protein L6e-domain-containing protein [Paraphysoderma sedebokerense]